MNKKIVIIGSRGIPASYSGFETSIQETAVRFVEKGYDVVVHCRKNHYKERPRSYRGVQLVYLPSVKQKFLDTISHTFLSVIWCYLNRIDYIVLYGVGNSLFIPFLRLKGVKVVSVLDGSDWERKKWNRFAKWFLRTNRHLAVHLSSHYVVDNELLAADYGREFKRQPAYIPYGANPIMKYDPAALTKFGLAEREYIVFIGRFVKEKGIDILIKAFEKTRTDKKLVIIGDNDLDQDYAASLRSTGDPRIIFTGFLYGEEYESILSKALFYVSASLLEGTSPSLLSAMAINGFALVSDLPENKEVLKGTCVTFATGNIDELKEKLDYYCGTFNSYEMERDKTRRIVEEYYSWDSITEKYLQLLAM